MAIQNVINEEGAPVTIGGAGHTADLRTGSVPFVNNLVRYVRLVDGQLSFARIYATQPLIGMCVGWLMRQSMQVPLKTYRRESEESRVRLGPRDHPLAAAIEAPWEGASSINLVHSLLGPYLIHGNGIDGIESGAREAIRFHPFDWRYALPVMPWRDRVVGWEVDRDDPTIKQTIGAEHMLHIANWSPLGPLGLSPLQQLGVTIAIEDAAARHQRQMLRNGARPPSAVMASEDFLKLRSDERKELLDILREDIDELYAGPDNAGRPALLPPGLTWQQVGHTAVEAQLIEQRVVNRVEAIGVYGLSPACVGVIERTTRVDEQRQMAITDGLAPPLIFIENAINAQIAAGLLKQPDIYVEFDFSGILRGDKLKEIEAIREGVSTAQLTPNEGRVLQNRPRSDQPGMDDFYLPRNNLWPLSVPYPGQGMGGGGEQATGEPTNGGTPATDPGTPGALGELESAVATAEKGD